MRRFAINLARLLTAVVLGPLLFYWCGFIFYTVYNAFHGGGRAIVQWYEYIATEGSLTRPWDWHRFVLSQTIALAITILFGMAALKLRNRPRWR